MIPIQEKKVFRSIFKGFFCYSESFIRVFIKRNESTESTQLDIELQLVFHTRFSLKENPFLLVAFGDFNVKSSQGYSNDSSTSEGF